MSCETPVPFFKPPYALAFESYTYKNNKKTFFLIVSHVLVMCLFIITITIRISIIRILPGAFF